MKVWSCGCVYGWLVDIHRTGDNSIQWIHRWKLSDDGYFNLLDYHNSDKNTIQLFTNVLAIWAMYCNRSLRQFQIPKFQNSKIPNFIQNHSQSLESRVWHICTSRADMHTIHTHSGWACQSSDFSSHPHLCHPFLLLNWLEFEAEIANVRPGLRLFLIRKNRSLWIVE
jgi:hypothetical protein